MKAEKETITLDDGDAAFVWRDDGSVESFIPFAGKDDDHMIEQDTPEGWAVVVTFLFGGSPGCLQQRQQLWTWVETLCEEPSPDADDAE